MRYAIIIVVFLILMSTACSDKTKTESDEAVLARVGDEVLTYSDIVYQIPADLRANLSDEDLQDAVETWINTEVLYREAVKMGLDKEPDVQAMIKWGIKETVAKKLIDSELSSDVATSSAEIDSIYQRQKDRLKVDKDRYRASHILLDDYQTAMAVYKRLEEGSDFGSLAMDYSVDRQSAKSGGDIGYFSEDQVESPFALAVKGLEKGEYSKPVETSYGFHIIKLTDKMNAGTKLDSLQAMKMIENQLKAGQKAVSFQNLVDSLRAESDIETFPLPGPEKRILQDGQ
jgi:hypothetical protein